MKDLSDAGRGPRKTHWSESWSSRASARVPLDFERCFVYIMHWKSSDLTPLKKGFLIQTLY